MRPESAHEADVVYSVFFSEGSYVLGMQNERKQICCTLKRTAYVLSTDLIKYVVMSEEIQEEGGQEGYAVRLHQELFAN